MSEVVVRRGEADAEIGESIFRELASELHPLVAHLSSVIAPYPAIVGLEQSLTESKSSMSDGILGADHQVVLNKVNLLLTMYCRARGNPADILQNVRWQRELYSRLPLRLLHSAARVVERSREFESSYQESGGGDRYVDFVSASLPDFVGAASVRGEGVSELLGLVEQMRVTHDPVVMQGIHRRFLLGISK